MVLDVYTNGLSCTRWLRSVSYCASQCRCAFYIFIPVVLTSGFYPPNLVFVHSIPTSWLVQGRSFHSWTPIPSSSTDGRNALDRVVRNRLGWSAPLTRDGSDVWDVDPFPIGWDRGGYGAISTLVHQDRP